MNTYLLERISKSTEMQSACEEINTTTISMKNLIQKTERIIDKVLFIVAFGGGFIAFGAILFLSLSVTILGVSLSAAGAFGVYLINKLVLEPVKAAASSFNAEVAILGRKNGF